MGRKQIAMMRRWMQDNAVMAAGGGGSGGGGEIIGGAGGELLASSCIVILPRGSQKPRGAWAPRASSKDILSAAEVAMREAGAKAATDTREARMRKNCILDLVEKL